MSDYFRFFGLPGSFNLTILMSLLALVMALIYRNKSHTLCLIAMLFSTGGDILLMDFRDLSDWLPGYFYAGAALFVVAHFFYLFAFRARLKDLPKPYSKIGVYAGGVICAVVFVYFTVTCIMRGELSIYPLAILYLAVIGANCITIFTYAFSAYKKKPLALLAAVGALSFFISDLFIGLDKMAGIDTFNGYIWWFYPIGQILLLIAP